MADAGWIKLHRGIADHWLWDCEFSYAQAWIDLLLKACHKPNKLMIKGQLVELKRGQQARSEVTLSKEWKWSRGKVRRFINQCENDGMIECKATRLTSIITICNYDSFQGVDTADGTANRTAGGTSVDTTNGQLTGHKQECKEVKNVEEGKKGNSDSASADVDFSPLCMTDEQVEEVKRIRKKTKGGALTQRVVNGLAVEFEAAAKIGWGPEDILSEWELRGWKSFKAEWISPKTSCAGGSRLGAHVEKTMATLQNFNWRD